MAISTLRPIPGLHLKVIPTLTENESIQVVFLERLGQVVARFMGPKQSLFIKPENMPKEVREVKSASHFEAFFRDVFGQTQFFKNGQINLSIYPRLRAGGGQTVVELEEDPDLVDKTMAIVKPGLVELSKMKIKDSAVLLVGRTGAGKSLLGDLLAKEPLRAVKVGLNFKLEPVNPQPIFPVSHSNTESCTGRPNVYSPINQNFTLIDLPGFGDTRYVEQDIANLFFRQEVLKNVNRMKIVLVIDWTDIDKKGEMLPNTFHDLLQFLGFEDIKDERLATLADSIILVVTHTPPEDDRTIREEVGEALKNYVNSPYGLKDNERSILRQVLQAGTWETFSSPTQKGDITKIMRDMKEIDILLHSNKSRYIAKTDTTIQTKVSKKHISVVENGIHSLIRDLKRELAGNILTEVAPYLERFYNQVPTKGALIDFQKKYHEAITSEAVRTISDFLKQLQFSPDIFTAGLLEEVNNQEERMKFLLDLLPNRTARKYPYQRDWAKELGIREPLLKWDATLTEITKDAVLKVSITADSKTKLTLQGYFPRISQITNEFHKYTDVREIDVHALHTVLIDEDLGGDKMRGVDVTIIAPKWEISNKQTINLTGKDSDHSYSPASNGQTYGASGSDGAPGQPGNNGGHFFGFGLAFTGRDNLTVISNGGKGGPGQSGGSGHVGDDGEDGTIKHDQGGKVHPVFGPSFYFLIEKPSGWDEPQFPPFRSGNNRYDQELRNKGKVGKPGGNGGKGGAGGVGGQPGRFEFIALNDPSLKLSTTRLHGKGGDSGAAGGVGLGGRNGRDWRGMWHAGGNPDWGWNGHEHPRFYPEKKDQCPQTGDPGIRSDEKNSSDRAPQYLLSPFNAMEHLYRYREFAIREGNPLTLASIEVHRRIYDQNTSISGKESIDNFIAECERMEDFFTEMEDKTKCLPLFQWMSERLQAYQVAKGNSAEAALLQCLYTHTLSKICQIKAAKDSRLIVDIKGFLEGVKKNVNELKDQTQIVNIQFYEKDYVGYLKSKMAEADQFVDKLRDDIRAADKEVVDQIKVFLKEVQDLRDKNRANQSDLKAKRDELKAELEKRKMLGFISVVVQAVGCCLPFVGKVVAGVVGAGLTAMSNSRAAAIGLGGAFAAYGDGIATVLQNDNKDNNPSFSSLHTAALTRLREVTMPAALVDIVDNKSGMGEEQQIAAMDKAIDEIDKQQQQLDAYRKEVKDTLEPKLHQVVDGASKAQQALKGQSKMGLEFSRLAIKRAFEAAQRHVKGATASFPSQGGFLLILQQLEEALQTTANMYEYVEEYDERRVLVNYLAALAAPTAQDPRIEVYKQKILRNVVLEQYARAVAAVHQWAFPFSSAYLSDLVTLKSFNDAKTLESLVEIIIIQLQLLHDKVKSASTETNSSIDTYVWRGEFSDKVTVGPFYTWTYKESKSEVVDLLSGKPVVLFADVSLTVEEMSAIKFNHVELQINSTNPISQVKLAKALQGVTVEMRHSGVSFYKYASQIYRMSNDTGLCIAYKWGASVSDHEAENLVYTKMKNGDYMLSPYASWTVTLKGAEGLYHAVADAMDTIQVSLVGIGQYVLTSKALGHVKGVDEYAKNRTFSKPGPGYISPSISKGKQEDDLKPTKKSSGGQQRVDGNALSESANLHYLYQATDISFMVQSPTIRDELSNFHFIQGMQAEHLTTKIDDDLIASVTINRPVLCVFNISNVHWVTLCLFKDTDDKLYCFYKDSFGQGNEELSRMLELRKCELISHPVAEQRGDSTSCGILAFENMRIMAHELNRDRDNFIEKFESLEFCSLDTANNLRKDDYPRFYAEGVQESERSAHANRARAAKIAADHQPEVDRIIARLRGGLQAGITVQMEDAGADAVRTIVVQIGLNDTRTDNYHYRIVGRQINEGEMIEVLTRIFGWKINVDYRTKDGVFKVSTKLAMAA